jgi:methanogenic corrinoid protein MtbC1
MSDSVERVAARSFREDAEDSPTWFGGALGSRQVPQRPVPRKGSGRELAPLLRAIEVEVIPRLVLARRGLPDGADALAGNAVVPCGVEEVAELAGLVLGRDAALASSFVETLRARGTSVEMLYLDLLAPAARHLGELWTADLCDFTEVTVGLGRLQQVLHELGPAFRTESEHHEAGRRALLVPLPGEQHTFGLFMVTEFFRRASWDVWSGSIPAKADLARMVREEWFAVVGFSVSSDRGLDTLAASIRAVRRASCNRGVGILVGGPVFLEHPDYVALVGADATAADGRQAVAQAHNLLSLLSRRC